MADAMIPYLSELGSSAEISPEKAEKNKALLQISTLAKEWAGSRAEKGLVSIDFDRCNRTYIRFRTPFMDKLIPDADGTKSGWNTTNHYFYEIVNRTGNSTYIQLALSSKEMPQGQLELSDRINEIYPSKYDKQGWQWRTPSERRQSVLTISLTKMHSLLNWMKASSAFGSLKKTCRKNSNKQA